MAAERVIRPDRLGDHGRVLRYPIVHRLSPIAIRPAVESAVAHRGQIIRGRLVAETIALVDNGPEHSGGRLPRQTYSVTQTACENAIRTACQIQFVDRRAAFLDLHALIGDVGERTDAGIELLFIGA